MSLYSDLVEILTPYANKIKGLAASNDQIRADLGDLTDLETEDKSSIVAAINEVASSGGGGGGGGSSTLSGLTDTRISNKADGQVLIYDGTSNKWINKTMAVATTSANGLMSATDKSRLDAVYADYSAAIAALGA